MIAKVDNLRNLHRIAVELIGLANHYMKKYPDFTYLLKVDHRNLIAEFTLFNPNLPEIYEQAERSEIDN